MSVLHYIPFVKVRAPDPDDLGRCPACGADLFVYADPDADDPPEVICPDCTTVSVASDG